MQYARMLAKKQLVKIGWEELQLMERESAGVISPLHAGGVCSDEMADLLHKTAEGWVSGLVLLNLTHQLSLLRTSNALNLNDFFEHVELTVWVIRFYSK